MLGPPADDLAHPAFGKLFVETEYLPESRALLCRRRPRAADEPGAWAVHVLSLEGRPQGPVEWETDRARFLGRGRDAGRPAGARRPAALRHHRRVLDPVVSLRQRIRLAPGGFVRLAFATGVAAETRDGRGRPGAAGTTTRRAPRAPSRWPSRTRRCGCATSASRATTARLFERLASRVLYADASLRADARAARRNTLGQEGLWPHGISGDLPILLVRVVEETTCRWCARCSRRRSTGDSRA